MGRAPCCDKANVKKGPWSPEEDAKLKSYIDQHGTASNWIALPQKIGLKRCGKSCRLRWLNYLRPNIKHGGFSEEEDNIICNLYVTIGSRWSIIAAQLPGRTDNDIKNYWNTRLKKKLLGKQRRKDKLVVEGARTKNNNNNKRMVSNEVIINPPPRVVHAYPPIPYANEEPRFDDHASIRKLLIRLGGRFSSSNDDEQCLVRFDHDQYYPVIDESIIQPPAVVYDNSSSMDLVPLLNEISDVPSLPIMNNVPNLEIERGVYEDVIIPEKLQGLEFFYDHDIIDNWGSEMNSFVDLAAASSCNINQGFLQGSIMEEFCIDKN